MSTLQVKKEVTKEIRKCFNLNKNENTTCQNLCNAGKVVLKEKSIPYINAFIRND